MLLFNNILILLYDLHNGDGQDGSAKQLEMCLMGVYASVL